MDEFHAGGVAEVLAVDLIREGLGGAHHDAVEVVPVLDAATGAALSAVVTCAAGVTGVTGVTGVGAGAAEKTAGDA